MFCKLGLYDVTKDTDGSLWAFGPFSHLPRHVEGPTTPQESMHKKIHNMGHLIYGNNKIHQLIFIEDLYLLTVLMLE